MKWYPFTLFMAIYSAPKYKDKFTCPVNVMRTIECRQISNIISTLIGSKIVDHSDVVGASPVDAVPTTSSFST